jgi:hypothetical protein
MDSNYQLQLSFKSVEDKGFSHYLVAQTLRGYDGNFIADSLVGLEVEGEFWVVAFDNDLGGLFDGLRSNATHFDRGVEVIVVGDSLLALIFC